MTVNVRNSQRYLIAGCAYIPFNATVVTNPVEVICGNARLEFCSDNVKYFSS